MIWCRAYATGDAQRTEVTMDKTDVAQLKGLH